MSTSSPSSDPNQLSRLRMLTTGLIPDSVWNAVIAILRGNQLLPAPDYRIKRMGFGYTLEILGLGTPSPTPVHYNPLDPVSDVSVGSSPKITIQYGSFGGQTPTIDGTELSADVTQNILTLGPTDVRVYIQCDFTFTSTGLLTITDTLISSTPDALPESEITGGSTAGGSGTVYWEIAGVVITLDEDTGNAHVKFAPSAGGAQNFGICVRTGSATTYTIWGA